VLTTEGAVTKPPTRTRDQSPATTQARSGSRPMRSSQRALIVASMAVLAIAMSSYCLDYQTRDAYRIRDQL